MKKFLTMLLSGFMIMSLVACSSGTYLGDDDDDDDDSGDSHKHVWMEASCSAPKTCSECGATKGEARDHNYQDNVCVYCGDKLPTKGLAYALNETDGETYATVIGIGECTDPDIVIESTYEGYPVTHIAEYAFSGTSIHSAIIPDSVTTIGKGAFHGCNNLTSVKLSKNLTQIGAECFNYTALTTVIMPKNIIDTGIYLFFSCNSLTHIFCEAEEPTYGWNNNWNGSDAKVYWGLDIAWEYVNGKPVHNHSWVAATCTAAQYCATCGEQGEGAKGHTWVDGADCYTPTICSVCNEPQGGARGHNFEDGKCTVCEAPQPSEGLTYKFNSTSNAYYVTGLGTCTDVDVILPDLYEGYPVICIDNYAFQNKKDIQSIYIPESILYIGGYAFSGCSGLTSITLPSQLQRITNKAFYNCTGLTSITLPGSIIDLGDCVFEKCTALTEAIISEGITSFGESTFYNCESLTTVVLPSTITAIERLAFYNCKALVSLVIPDGVTSIDENAFYGCDALTEITLPEGLLSIANYAFYNCKALASIILPNTLTSIGASAFDNCDSLTSIIIPASVTQIGAIAFYGCDQLSVIYCYVTEQPADWHSNWNKQNVWGTTYEVLWGYEAE